MRRVARMIGSFLILTPFSLIIGLVYMFSPEHVSAISGSQEELPVQVSAEAASTADYCNLDCIAASNIAGIPPATDD